MILRREEIATTRKREIKLPRSTRGTDLGGLVTDDPRVWEHVASRAAVRKLLLQYIRRALARFWNSCSPLFVSYTSTFFTDAL
jgi:hypothetical protein